MDFEYFPEYDLIILGARNDKLHYIVYDQEAKDYKLWYSYNIPDLYNGMANTEFRSQTGERIPRFPTAIQRIDPKED